MERMIKLVGSNEDIDLAIAKLHSSMREEEEFDVKIMEKQE